MTTMTQVATSGEQRIVLCGVSWETYQALRHTEESRRGSVRMTYDRGRLVLMSPSQEHVQHAERLGLMIRMAALGMGLNCMGVGRMTLLRKEAQRGKEPDTAFYLANEPLVRAKEIDLDVDPPLDLAVEVEIAHEDKEKLGVYATLGVPEVWHYDGRSLRVLQLQANASYQPVAASPALPFLPMAEIPRWLERAESEGETAMLAAFLDWVRNDLSPRRP